MLGRRGAVATSQPLAAHAGMSMLQAGGNAVDAAIAMTIALTVVEPTSNGIGSDAFALVWADGKLHGLNASGRAPATATIDAYRALGHEAVPELGWAPVTVPGAVSAWAEGDRWLSPSRRSCRSSSAVGSSDRHELPRFRCLGDPTQRSRDQCPKRAEHHGRVRPRARLLR